MGDGGGLGGGRGKERRPAHRSSFNLPRAPASSRSTFRRRLMPSKDDAPIKAQPTPYASGSEPETEWRPARADRADNMPGLRRAAHTPRSPSVGQVQPLAGRRAFDAAMASNFARGASAQSGVATPRQTAPRAPAGVLARVSALLEMRAPGPIGSDSSGCPLWAGRTCPSGRGRVLQFQRD